MDRKNPGENATRILYLFKRAHDEIQMARHEPDDTSEICVHPKQHFDDMAIKALAFSRTPPSRRPINLLPPELKRYGDTIIHLDHRKDFWRDFHLSQFGVTHVAGRPIKKWYWQIEKIRMKLISTAKLALTQQRTLHAITKKAGKDRENSLQTDEQELLNKKAGLQSSIDQCHRVLWPWACQQFARLGPASPENEDGISKNLNIIIAAMENICNPLIEVDKNKIK